MLCDAPIVTAWGRRGVVEGDDKVWDLRSCGVWFLRNCRCFSHPQALEFIFDWHTLLALNFVVMAYYYFIPEPHEIVRAHSVALTGKRFPSSGLMPLNILALEWCSASSHCCQCSVLY